MFTFRGSGGEKNTLRQRLTVRGNLLQPVDKLAAQMTGFPFLYHSMS